MPERANTLDGPFFPPGSTAASHADAFRDHLRSIVESRAFRGSRRSQEFLRFIVEHALDNHFEDLKERRLGVELFGRSPSYDTSDDAIVRVTACDVRKRLAHFYADTPESDFRVNLAPGSYVPEFHQVSAGSDAAPKHAALETVSLPPAPAALPEIPGVRAELRGARPAWQWFATAVLVGFLCAAGFSFWMAKSAAARPPSVLPWSAIVQPGRQIHVVFCDPEIVMVQRLLDTSISLSDYANQQYWPADQNADTRRVLQFISFRGASVAAVDSAMALRIDRLVAPRSQEALQAHTARRMRLADFKTADNFVLLGSPRSNPWVDLFQDQLDFAFAFDGARRAEFVRNRNPRPGEASTYVPTAQGFGTGDAYGIVALVANPEQSGNVLLVAGSTAEATEAAGELATNPAALSAVLARNGIEPAGPPRRFEILLRVSTMAGSPNTSQVVAFHALNGTARHP